MTANTPIYKSHKTWGFWRVESTPTSASVVSCEWPFLTWVWQTRDSIPDKPVIVFQHFGCWCSNISYLEIREKPGIFRLPYQPYSSLGNCVRKLLKSSKDLPSLRVRNAKNFGLWVVFFCEWHHTWGRFLAILAHVTWPRAQLLDKYFAEVFIGS